MMVRMRDASPIAYHLPLATHSRNFASELRARAVERQRAAWATEWDARHLCRMGPCAKIGRPNSAHICIVENASLL